MFIRGNTVQYCDWNPFHNLVYLCIQHYYMYFYCYVVVKDPTGIQRLNFARLIISYTRRFALTDVREAVQYFYLLKVCTHYMLYVICLHM